MISRRAFPAARLPPGDEWRGSLPELPRLPSNLTRTIAEMGDELGQARVSRAGGHAGGSRRRRSSP